MYRKIVQILFCISSVCGFMEPLSASIHLPKQARVPGGVAILELDVECQASPIVKYIGKRTCVIPHPQHPQKWIAVVGVPLEATLGQNKIDIETGQGSFVQNFVIQAKHYPTEHLNIPDKRKVQPNPADLALIEKEYLETIATYDQWQDQTLSSLKLEIPVQGRKSSPFGLQRIMNKIPKNPHSGLDIAAPLGTKVICSKDGIVSNIGNYFYSGNIVFVDHGQGFITSYCHLNSVVVKMGQVLKQGDVLGTVGKTGRATGPHLHWSVSLNGVRVDPQLFING